MALRNMFGRQPERKGLFHIHSMVHTVKKKQPEEYRRRQIREVNQTSGNYEEVMV